MQDRINSIKKSKCIFSEDIRFLISIIETNQTGEVGRVAASISKASRITLGFENIHGFDLRIEKVNRETNMWAIRSGNYRLNKQLQWTHEPLDKTMHTEFFTKNHTFTFAEVFKFSDEIFENMASKKFT